MGKAGPKLADGAKHGLFDRTDGRPEFLGNLLRAPLLQVLQYEAHAFDIGELLEVTKLDKRMPGMSKYHWYVCM